MDDRQIIRQSQRTQLHIVPMAAIQAFAMDADGFNAMRSVMAYCGE